MNKMCLDPIFMTQGKPRGICPVVDGGAVMARTLPEYNCTARVAEISDSARGICKYAEQGCEGATNGIVFYEFCERNGRSVIGLDCPVKLERNGEDRQEDKQ